MPMNCSVSIWMLPSFQRSGTNSFPIKEKYFLQHSKEQGYRMFSKPFPKRMSVLFLRNISMRAVPTARSATVSVRQGHSLPTGSSLLFILMRCSVSNAGSVTMPANPMRSIFRKVLRSKSFLNRHSGHWQPSMSNAVTNAETILPIQAEN